MHDPAEKIRIVLEHDPQKGIPVFAKDNARASSHSDRPSAIGQAKERAERDAISREANSIRSKPQRKLATKSAKFLSQAMGA
jgi:hypothetical protein